MLMALLPPTESQQGINPGVLVPVHTSSWASWTVNIIQGNEWKASAEDPAQGHKYNVSVVTDAMNKTPTLGFCREKQHMSGMKTNKASVYIYIYIPEFQVSYKLVNAELYMLIYIYVRYDIVLVRYFKAQMQLQLWNSWSPV